MTIDIIIPTMGRSLTLIRSVRSAVVSLLPSMRIIVINDGEVNVTKLLHDVFEKEINDGHIVILKNSGIHGASAARNFGAEASENELMFFLDDDDELIFGSLEQVLLASKQGYNYGFSVSASGIQKNIIGAKIEFLPVRKRFAATSSAFWINRQVFIDVGKFSCEMTVGEDFDLCARLLASRVPGWASFRPGVLRGNVTNDGELSSLVKRTTARETIRCRHILMQRNIDKFTIWDGERYYLIEQYVRRSVRSGLSSQCLRKLLRMFPSWIATFGLLVWLSNVTFGPKDKE